MSTVVLKQTDQDGFIDVAHTPINFTASFDTQQQYIYSIYIQPRPVSASYAGMLVGNSAENDSHMYEIPGRIVFWFMLEVYPAGIRMLVRT